VITVGRFKTDAPFTQAEREVFACSAHTRLWRSRMPTSRRSGGPRDPRRAHRLYNAGTSTPRWTWLSLVSSATHPPKPAAIMFDLDHFATSIAATASGRRCLASSVREILRVRLRSADIVARYGGEEFVAILEDCASEATPAPTKSAGSSRVARCPTPTDDRCVRP